MSRTTKRIVGLACSVVALAILLWGAVVHRRDVEYRELGEQCATALNEVSTILEDAHANREKLWEKHPAICLGLNMHVIGKVKPAAERFVAARDSFLAHHSQSNLKALRIEVEELQALDRAAKDIMATNSGVKLKL